MLFLFYIAPVLIGLGVGAAAICVGFKLNPFPRLWRAGIKASKRPLLWLVRRDLDVAVSNAQNAMRWRHNLAMFTALKPPTIEEVVSGCRVASAKLEGVEIHLAELYQEDTDFALQVVREVLAARRQDAGA